MVWMSRWRWEGKLEWWWWRGGWVGRLSSHDGQTGRCNCWGLRVLIEIEARISHKKGKIHDKRRRDTTRSNKKNSPNQSLPPSSRTQFLRFPHKANQFTPDNPIGTISCPLQFLLGDPSFGDSSLSFPGHDLLPYTFVDGVMDGDYDGHILG